MPECVGVSVCTCAHARACVFLCICVCVLPFQSLKMNIGKFRLEHSEELGLKQRSLYVNNCFFDLIFLMKIEKTNF